MQPAVRKYRSWRKNYAVRDLAELLKIYGLPIRIGTYRRTTVTGLRFDPVVNLNEIGDLHAIVPRKFIDALIDRQR